MFFMFFIFELWQESQGKADSIGIWYTAYCALIYAIPASVIVAIILKIKKVG